VSNVAQEGLLRRTKWTSAALKTADVGALGRLGAYAAPQDGWRGLALGCRCRPPSWLAHARRASARPRRRRTLAQLRAATTRSSGARVRGAQEKPNGRSGGGPDRPWSCWAAR
jgi:hypothetical protein